MQDFEKLGAFYLGRRMDPAAGKPTEDLLLYDSKDLTTHAVIVGMTGSGKTGLGVALLEEAAIDGIPSLVIDPKGDMGNLMLAFPDLAATDFLPWVDAGEAARQGMDPARFAAATAETWKKGLAQWGQGGERIRRYREAADVAIYTPGSNAGLPLAILRSFDAPPPALLEDGDALRERVTSTVSGLLALLGIQADPLRSREHMFLATVLDGAWRDGRDLDLPALIREVQQPRFDRIGVMDLESFYPAKERFDLAMAINGLLASPGFATWTKGEPLDVGRLLWTEQGKPRISIVSIAHLGDAERMFFLTTLLNAVVAWVRAQAGTSSLRALLYMDEIFGYFPPNANPPTKLPMLTLLKQARAFGLGVVLSTQNPVDLDYKGLANAGTWFLGRLQTERDKMRVLEGLEGASAAAGQAFDRARMEATLAGLGKRVFLMNSVHEDQPVLFQTRWALSYLRGPLTRVQIQTLMKDRLAAASAPTGPATPPPPAPPARPPGPSAPGAATPSGERPVLPPEVAERFLAPRKPLGEARLEYRPALLAPARLHHADRSAGVDEWRSAVLSAAMPADEFRNPWEGAALLPEAPAWEKTPDARAAFAPLPAAAMRARTYDAWLKAAKEHLYRSAPLRLHRAASMKEVSRPGESEGDFRVRLGQRARERRDIEVEALRRKYAPKVQALRERLRQAEQRVDRERSQATQAKVQTSISFGATVLGALFGRKLGSAGNVGRATTAARGVGRATKEAQDVARAEETVGALRRQIQDLEAQASTEVARLQAGLDPAALGIEPLEIAPRKADLGVEAVYLAWVPWRVESDGRAEPLA